MSETIDDTDSDSGAVEGGDETGDGDELVAQEKHSLALRWMHWLNFPLLMIMMYTGMRIYWADVQEPYALGIGGWQIFRFWPDRVNSGFDLERKLAKGIAFHLNFGWFFVINGAAYLFYLSRHGEWRHIVPDRQSVRDAGKMVAHDLHLRSDKPVHGKYNPAQQVTYTLVIAIAALLVTSGFAIYKPGQLSWLTAAFGGYNYARFVHFSCTILLLVFFFVHIFQVARSGWANFASIITGYRLGRRGDPEVAPASAFGPDGIEGTADDPPGGNSRPVDPEPDESVDQDVEHQDMEHQDTGADS